MQGHQLNLAQIFALVRLSNNWKNFTKFDTDTQKDRSLYGVILDIYS